MAHDLLEAIKNPSLWIYSTWVQFLIIYRRTALGPLWIILGPLMFVILLGFLFSVLGSVDQAIFIPHFASGFIIWTFIGGVISAAAGLYPRSKGALMSGLTNHTVLYLRLITTAAIKFIHQIVIIIAVCVIYNVTPKLQLVLVLPAMMLLILHSYWVSICFSTLAARFRDVAQMVEIVMRIGFLATPVIWMPGEGARGNLIGSYLIFNPFYHILEPVRSAILGTAYPYRSLWISIIMAVFGLLLATLVYNRFSKKTTLWV